MIATAVGNGERHYIAVVYSPRGVRLVAVATSAALRDQHVGDYVRRQAPHQLAPGTRDRVLALHDRGAVGAAIAAYFEAVGREWDDEWLYLDAVAQVPGCETDRDFRAGNRVRVASRREG